MKQLCLQLGEFNIAGHEDTLRKIVLDALPLLKTDSAVALMSTLVKTKAYPAPDSWFTSLAYYKNPTRSMMESVLVRANTFFSDCFQYGRAQTIVLISEFCERPDAQANSPFGSVFHGADILPGQPRLLPGEIDFYCTVSVYWSLLNSAGFSAEICCDT